MFSTGRNWEQIRTTICYNDVPVKIAGSHAGVSVGPDGGTHQAVEDIAITRVIPNMVVIAPCDAIEARKATLAIAKTKQPTYLRLAREKTPIITSDDSPLESGRANPVWLSDKPEVAVFACGALLHKGLHVDVVNIHTIKPIDEEAIVLYAKKAGAVVVVEEHQVNGGLGGAVAEVLAKKAPTPMEFVGVEDKFGQSGAPNELIEHYGMGVNSIMEKIQLVIKRK